MHTARGIFFPLTKNYFCLTFL